MRKGYVRRALIGGLVLMMLLSGISWAAAEILGGAITLMRTPQGGDEMILLQMDAEETEKMQSAVMSGKEDVLSSAVLDEDLLILWLSRPLKSGEDIHVTVSVNERFQKTLELTVKSALNPKLERMEEKIRGIVENWKKQVFSELQDDIVYLPTTWKAIPIALYPDEAPEICVNESDEDTEITLSGRLPEGWKVCLAKGLPVELKECTWDEQKECWTGSGEFESVYITREGIEDHVSIEIVYSKDMEYLPQYPVLLYKAENGSEVEALVCYGWGTAREYNGGMYTVVGNGKVYYAEYNPDHTLRCYYDQVNGTEYDARDHLTAGTEPENYVNPVVHRK